VTLAPGARLGSYEIVAPLGAGGMGEVWRARDTRLGRDVAVKVLPDTVARNPEALSRFEKETRAVASLSHPNILAIFDVGSADGLAYAVLELLEGETLRERLSAGALPARKAVEIGVQVARALAAAHERGVVHRDLKPENLFVTRDGVVKVLDFGLARIASGGTDSTSAPTEAGTAPGTILGTVGYMAPEQVRGRTSDSRADVFAFGCVLHEMLVGRRAFRGDSAADVMSAILKEEPAEPETPIPPALSQIVRHCLEKRPEDRFQSARDLAFALDALSLSTSSGSSVGAITPGRPRLASRALPWIAAAAALLIGIGAAKLVRRAPQTPARTVRFSIPPAKGLAYAGMLALSPDGSRLAFVASGADGYDRIWLRPLDGLDARQLAGTEGATFPFFSPDGRHLGFFASQTLKTVDLESSAVQTLCRARSARGGSWSKAGLILFASGTGAEIDLVPSTGGEPKKVAGIEAASGEGSLRWPTFLADGRRFLYLSYGAEHSVLRLASLDAPQRTTLVRADSAPFVTRGMLVYAVGERLVAHPFDEAKARLTGTARPLAEGIFWDAFASGAFGLSLSESGDLAYLSGGVGKSRLFWYERGGRRLEGVGPAAPLFEPEFSPDESRVAVSVADVENGWSNTWLLDLSRGGIARVSEQPAAVTPLFSHDGTRIAYSTFPSGHVFVRDVGGAAPSRVLFEPGIFSPLDDWTADGRLLYTTIDFKTFHFQAAQLPPGGGKPEPLLSGPDNYQMPHLSPDGRWLAYVSDESGRDEVLLRSFPDGRQRFAVSAGGGSQPRWRGDGKELYYVTPDRKIMSVAMGSEPGKPQMLFQSRIVPLVEARNHYAVTKDGQRFLVNERLDDDAARPIVVDLNAIR
jgi:Tol biopolymer transport system component